MAPLIPGKITPTSRSGLERLTRAGALRSDPKSGDPEHRRTIGLGHQRDEVRILNYARCVRGGLAGP